MLVWFLKMADLNKNMPWILSSIKVIGFFCLLLVEKNMLMCNCCIEVGKDDTSWYTFLELKGVFRTLMNGGDDGKLLKRPFKQTTKKRPTFIWDEEIISNKNAFSSQHHVPHFLAWLQDSRGVKTKMDQDSEPRYFSWLIVNEIAGCSHPANDKQLRWLQKQGITRILCLSKVWVIIKKIFSLVFDLICRIIFQGWQNFTAFKLCLFTFPNLKEGFSSYPAVSL